MDAGIGAAGTHQLERFAGRPQHLLQRVDQRAGHRADLGLLANPRKSVPS